VPFDPNGMVMDLVRSCYSRNIRFVNGDPTQKAKATWYRAAPTALVFPGAHAFGSANWDTVHPTPIDLGDQEGDPWRWYNGRRINRSDGTRFAGPAAFFLHGADAPAILPRGTDGTPVECLKPPFGKIKGGLCVPSIRFAGGKIKGGLSPLLVGPCSCASLQAGPITVVVVNGTGVFVPFIGMSVVLDNLGTYLGTMTAAVIHHILINGSCVGGVLTLRIIKNAPPIPLTPLFVQGSCPFDQTHTYTHPVTLDTAQIRVHFP
jgi:hypothetical protein